jgi:hypothetical protein
MKLIYALLCDSAFLSIDRKVNIIGVFETINATNFPVNHPKFVLVGSMKPSKTNFSMGVEIIMEGNKQILNQAQEREVRLPDTNDDKNFNFIIEIVNTVFPQIGNYSVNLLIDGKIISSQKLTLGKQENIGNFN